MFPFSPFSPQNPSSQKSGLVFCPADDLEKTIERMLLKQQEVWESMPHFS